MTDPTTGHDYPGPSEGEGGGAVASVNGQTGAVVLGAEDVGAITPARETTTEIRDGYTVNVTPPGVQVAFGAEDDDHARVVVANGSLMFGSPNGAGGSDPYNDTFDLRALNDGSGDIPAGVGTSGSFQANGGLYDETGAKVPSTGSVLPIADSAGVAIDTETYAGHATPVFPDDSPVVQWALTGDVVPRVRINSDPTSLFVRLTDGTGDADAFVDIYFDAATRHLVLVPGVAVEIDRPLLVYGDVEVGDSSKGVVQSSPDGTRWRLVVGDGGVGTWVDASILVSDTFTRANATPLGVAETGQTWESLTGTGLSVISNQAGTASTSNHIDVIDAGVADCIVTVTYVAVLGGGNSGVVLRAADDANYLRLDDIGRLIETVDGSLTVLGTMTNDDIGAGDVIEVTLSGTTAEVRRNGTLELTRTVAATGTKHGLRIDGSTTPRFDAFTVRSLP